METITYTGTLAVEECYKCHITFAMPKDLQQRARQQGETFYCPLGHGQVYSMTEVAELKAKLAREQEWREQAEIRERAARDQADAATRSARAYKGQVTRVRKRVGNGVCPCCHRTFVQLAAHMTAKHPDYRDGGQ
jgi:hypothetical protein